MINVVTIIGRVTVTPELKKTTTGKSVVKIPIANDLTKDKTIFVNITAYNHSAEYIAKYAKKGTTIAVSGYLEVWRDSDRVYHTEIVARDVQIINQPKSEAGTVLNDPVMENNPVADYLNNESEELPW